MASCSVGPHLVQPDGIALFVAVLLLTNFNNRCVVVVRVTTLKGKSFLGITHLRLFVSFLRDKKIQ